MVVARGIETNSVLRPNHGGTNRVWRMVWSRSRMGVENQVPNRWPKRFGSARCHVPESVRTWKSNVRWMVSWIFLSSKLPMVGLIPMSLFSTKCHGECVLEG